MREPPSIPRTVKPRKPDHSRLPVIAVDQWEGVIAVERTGELVSIDEAVRLVLTEPSSLWIIPAASNFVRILDERMRDHPSWQFRGSPSKRPTYGPTGPSRVVVQDFIVAFFGLSAKDKKSRGHYHYPIDPNVFLRRHLDALSGSGPLALRLLRWGVDVANWCEAQGLTPKPTAGGIAGQLLRDKRFFPEDRRKVPKATNARIRQALPGNYYRLFTAPERPRDAIYLDLKSAHHNAAVNIRFPDPNTMLARGRFKETDKLLEDSTAAKAWLRPGQVAFDALLARSHGLLLAHLTVPRLKPDRFPPPCCERPGQHLVFVYTNELPMLKELGVIIDGIEAAWTSYRVDRGLNRYAEWALSEIAGSHPVRKPWLKPTLLATYGVLASKPRTTEFAYANAHGGTLRHYPAGSGRIPALSKRSETEVETQTVNVVYRGMIEAQTRMDVLAMARYVTSRGVEVLSIYADSVFVAADGAPLPLLPHPWDTKGQLTRCKFFNATSFVSQELCKLPGIPLDARERLQIAERMRRRVASVRAVR